MLKKRIAIIFAVLTMLLAVVYYLHNRYAHDGYKSRLESLMSLPYVTWSESGAEDAVRGVMKNDRERSFFGYNFYTDYDKNAYLMDNDGQIVHKWEFPFQGRWEHAELLKDGGILGICVGKCFIKLNRDSNVVWMYKIRTHHDIAVLPDNTYLIPVTLDMVVYNSRKVIFNSVLHISEDGTVLDEWSTFANFERLKKLHPPSGLDKIRGWGKLYLLAGNPIIRIKREDKSAKLPLYNSTKPDRQKEYGLSLWKKRLKKLINKILGWDKRYDYYHLNAVESIPDTPLGRIDKRFKKGNYLICLGSANLILILDKDSKEVVWSWGAGILDLPHDPTMLENGNILLFDNGYDRSYSRVLEIDPVGAHIVWEYKTSPPENFHSSKWGSAQRLPNGNTLICESEKGHVFEIDREDNVVWEFLNPEIKDGKVKVIYRMLRVPKEKVEGWLEPY
ncbi:MAG: hypothetical protein A2Z72_08150 [Omnitrophica bacterium RBG_13_46_9]|nr:MAG: hypothetical protein A2Z72_08150 [Omnitrophica bacterium RBG_13_46_9]